MNTLIKKILINTGVLFVLLMFIFTLFPEYVLGPILKANNRPLSSRNVRASKLVGAYECSYTIAYDREELASDSCEPMPPIKSAFLERSYKKRSPFNPNLILIPDSYNLNLILEDRKDTDGITIARGTHCRYLTHGEVTLKLNTLPGDTVHVDVSCSGIKQTVILTRIEPNN